MLHVLLENPPGDFPYNIREDFIDGFIGIFAHVRDEGEISRKLVDCVNTYLFKDGPNLGCRAIDIHAALRGVLFCFWLTTHDRGLKNSFILYARIQLKLGRSILDETELIGQLLDVISKELDYSSSISSSAIPWCAYFLPIDSVANLIMVSVCVNALLSRTDMKRLGIWEGGLV
ncbi:putative non-specific serine/threonine protein kinase [Dioscorea sansibarensis]